jgi:high-affinity iron transporter
MLATLLIVFREMIEAGLIIGIVLAATRGVAHRARWIVGGVAGGILGACLVAAFANTISGMMHGMGQELFNVGILLVAVLMLTWHNVWMARHGREMATTLKAVGADVTAGRKSLLAVAIVVGTAVLREGAEVVLFLYGIAVSGNDSTLSMIAGGALGVGLGGIISALMYAGLLRVPSRHIFKVTSWLIALLAAGMAAQAVVLLQQAQFLPFLTHEVWNTSFLIKDSSMLGKALHTLVGYTARPNAMQLLAYGFTLVTIFVLMRVWGHAPKTVRSVAAN